MQREALETQWIGLVPCIYYITGLLSRFRNRYHMLALIPVPVGQGTVTGGGIRQRADRVESIVSSARSYPPREESSCAHSITGAYLDQQTAQ